MSTYQGIRGFKIPSLASDPSTLVTGLIWFNTTSATLKFYNGTSTQTITMS